MRKLFSLFLCVLMICLTLTGCSESFIDKFKEDIHQYDDIVLSTDRKALELDFYIICGEKTTERSKEDVERFINAYLADLYNTTLDMHYLTEAEYAEIALADSLKTGEERADIVLIAGKDMFDRFYEQNALADISVFFSEEQAQKYGLLNTLIASTLLESSIISVPAVNEYGTSYIASRYYTVPNNHVIGEYEYILIDKEAARHHYYSNRQLEEIVTVELAEELKAVLGEENVKQVSGIYSDKARYEQEGYHVNVVSYPVADVEEAFLSAFSIVRHELDTRYMQSEDNITIEAKNEYNSHYDRCMEIIYALSADETFRNLLQYGYRGTNYTLTDDNMVERFVNSAGEYDMNLLYTGNVFKALYCEAIGWNDAAYNNGIEQNKEAIVPAKDTE